MDKDLKNYKPMICPVCGKFYFTKLSEDDIKENINPNEEQCNVCGWFYDLEQTNNPDLKNQSNKMSLNEYKEWYKAKIKENKNWDYLKSQYKPTPHKCPLCGEYSFKEELQHEICPVCGWEDSGYEEFPDEQMSISSMTFNERKKWFEKQRKKDSKFKVYKK